MYKNIIELLKNKNIAILGFGVEGQSTYRFIRRFLKDQVLTIIDRNDISDKVSTDHFINIVSGDNYLSDLEQYDLIIKSPGISFKDIDISNINEKITSQLELLLMTFKQNIIGITGTKGKSTTSTLLYEVIKAQGKDAYLLGNIGNPVLDDIEKFTSESILVVEISSHQLEFINKSPHYGVVLNLFEDHLDHAGSVEHYHACKMNMFKYQKEQDISIYCGNDEKLKNQINNHQYSGIFYKFQEGEKNIDDKTIYVKDKHILFNGQILYDTDNDRKLLGDHNIKNIMVVLLLTRLFNLDIEKAIQTINSFNPLPHRLEYVGIYDGITYYSDTIATIPEATIEAVKTLKKVNTLIFGGMDRGINYDKLTSFLENCDIENLICMPTTGINIGRKLKTNKNIIYVNTLDEAVLEAKRITKKNTICLLSPAAPSYEYYRNFEEKGKAYQKIIKKYHQ